MVARLGLGGSNQYESLFLIMFNMILIPLLQEHYEISSQRYSNDIRLLLEECQSNESYISVLTILS